MSKLIGEEMVSDNEGYELTENENVVLSWNKRSGGGGNDDGDKESDGNNDGDNDGDEKECKDKLPGYVCRLFREKNKCYRVKKKCKQTCDWK